MKKIEWSDVTTRLLLGIAAGSLVYGLHSQTPDFFWVTGTALLGVASSYFAAADAQKQTEKKLKKKYKNKE